MSAIKEDDDTVLEPVATVVVAEAVNESNNVGVSSNMQQSNTTMQKKTRFSWSHHGMNPKFVDTYIVHEANHKDEILIRHLMQSLSMESQTWKYQSCVEESDGWDTFGENWRFLYFHGYQHEHHPEQIPKCVSCTG